MKTLAIIIIVGLACFGFGQCSKIDLSSEPLQAALSDSVYFENILSDKSTHRCYLAFDVSAPDYRGRVVIMNIDLGYYFVKGEG